jgi:hypothetical protein
MLNLAAEAADRARILLSFCGIRARTESPKHLIFINDAKYNF